MKIFIPITELYHSYYGMSMTLFLKWNIIKTWKRQAYFLKEVLNRNFFTEEELDIIIRARNHKGNRHPKNTDILTYKHATAFEAVIGSWHQTNCSRFQEMMKIIYEEICNF